MKNSSLMFGSLAATAAYVNHLRRKGRDPFASLLALRDLDSTSPAEKRGFTDVMGFWGGLSLGMIGGMWLAIRFQSKIRTVQKLSSLWLDNDDDGLVERPRERKEATSSSCIQQIPVRRAS